MPHLKRGKPGFLPPPPRPVQPPSPPPRPAQQKPPVQLPTTAPFALQPFKMPGAKPTPPTKVMLPVGVKGPGAKAAAKPSAKPGGAAVAKPVGLLGAAAKVFGEQVGKVTARVQAQPQSLAMLEVQSIQAAIDGRLPLRLPEIGAVPFVDPATGRVQPGRGVDPVVAARAAVGELTGAGGQLAGADAEQLAEIARDYLRRPGNLDLRNARVLPVLEFLGVDNLVIENLKTRQAAAMLGPLKHIVDYIAYPARVAEAGLTVAAYQGMPMQNLSWGPGTWLPDSPEFEKRRQIYLEVAAKHDWVDIFNVHSRLGWTMAAYDADKMRAVWRDVDAGLDFEGIVQRHEDVGVEFIGQLLADPLNLLPVAWMKKLFPLHVAAGEAVARGVTYGVKTTIKVPAGFVGRVSDWLTDFSKQTKLQAIGHTTTDAITQLWQRRSLIPGGTGQNVAELFERAIAGEEPVLKVLGPQLRQFFTNMVKPGWDSLGIKNLEQAVQRWGDDLSKRILTEKRLQFMAQDDAVRTYVIERAVLGQFAKAAGVELNFHGGLASAVHFVQRVLRENWLATFRYRLQNAMDNTVKQVLRGYNPTAYGFSNPEIAVQFLAEKGLPIRAGVLSGLTAEAAGMVGSETATAMLMWPLGTRSPLTTISDLSLWFFGKRKVPTLESLTERIEGAAVRGLIDNARTVTEKFSLAKAPIVGVEPMLVKSLWLEQTARLNVDIQAMLRAYEERGIPAVTEVVQKWVDKGVVSPQGLDAVQNSLGLLSPEVVGKFLDDFLPVPPVGRAVVPAAVPQMGDISVYPWAKTAPGSGKILGALSEALAARQAAGEAAEEISLVFDYSAALAGRMREESEIAAKMVYSLGDDPTVGIVRLEIPTGRPIFNFEDSEKLLARLNQERWDAAKAFTAEGKRMGLGWRGTPQGDAYGVTHDYFALADDLLESTADRPELVREVTDKLSEAFRAGQSRIRELMGESVKNAVKPEHAAWFRKYEAFLLEVHEAQRGLFDVQLRAANWRALGQMSDDEAQLLIRSAYEQYTTRFLKAAQYEVPDLPLALAKGLADRELVVGAWDETGNRLAYRVGGGLEGRVEHGAMLAEEGWDITESAVYKFRQVGGTLLMQTPEAVEETVEGYARFARYLMSQGVSGSTPAMGFSHIADNRTRMLADWAEPTRMYEVLVTGGTQETQRMARLLDALEATGGKMVTTREEALEILSRRPGGLETIAELGEEDLIARANIYVSHGTGSSLPWPKGSWIPEHGWVFESPGARSGMHPDGAWVEGRSVPAPNIRLSVAPDKSLHLWVDPDLLDEAKTSARWLAEHGLPLDTPLRLDVAGAVGHVSEVVQLKDFLSKTIKPPEVIKEIWHDTLEQIPMGKVATAKFNPLDESVRFAISSAHRSAGDEPVLVAKMIPFADEPWIVAMTRASPDLTQKMAQRLVAAGVPEDAVVEAGHTLRMVADGLMPKGWTETIQGEPIWQDILRRTERYSQEQVEQHMYAGLRNADLYRQLVQGDDELKRTVYTILQWKQWAMKEMTLGRRAAPSAAAAEVVGAQVGEARDDIMRVWTEQLENASIYGEWEVDRNLIHYWKSRGATNALTHIFPFVRWQMNNPRWWMETFLQKPALLAHAYRLLQMTQKIKDDNNLTARFDDTLPMPLLQALANAGVLPPGYWAFEPMQVFSIFGQLQQPFETPGEKEVTAGGGLAGLVKGALTGAEAIGLQPWPWWREAARAGGLYPGEPLPGVLGAAGRYPPWGTALERAIRNVRTGGQVPDIDKYYINRQLAAMAAQGEITQQQAMQAIDNPQSYVYQQAEQQVRQWQDAMSGVSTVLPFTIKHASPGELKLRQLVAQYGELRDDPVAQARFLREHPELNVYWTAQRPELERGFQRERQLIYNKYEQQLQALLPWDSARQQVYAARQQELDELESRYSQQGLQINAPDAAAVNTPSDVLRRLRDWEPRADQFVTTDGQTDWDSYNQAVQQFRSGLPDMSRGLGQSFTWEQYDTWRNVYKTPIEQAWDLQQGLVRDAWEKAARKAQMGPSEEFIGLRRQFAGEMGPSRPAAYFADMVARRLDITREQALRELEEFPDLPGAIDPRSPDAQLKAQYYALNIHQKERFRVQFDIPEGMTLSNWIAQAGPDKTEQALTELRSIEGLRWLLTPTPRQSFWDHVGALVLMNHAYDDPVLAPILNREGREVYGFTQAQYDSATRYLAENYDRLVDTERMMEASRHPLWWERATQQRDVYRDFTEKHTYSRAVEREYFAAKDIKRDARWISEHPSEWKYLQDYWDEKAAVRFDNPFYSYFFAYDDYSRWFHSMNPEAVQQQIGSLRAGWNTARRDMALYEAGAIKEWTPAMEQWFGRDTPVSRLWDQIFALPPGATEWHKRLWELPAYKITQQLQALKREDWLERIPDATAQRALQDLQKWIAANPRPPRPDTSDYWLRERGRGAMPTEAEEWGAVRASRSQWRDASGASDWDRMDELLRLYGALWRWYGYWVPAIGSYRPREEGSGPQAGPTPQPPAPPPVPTMPPFPTLPPPPP